jgi:hypothetical protein
MLSALLEARTLFKNLENNTGDERKLMVNRRGRDGSNGRSGKP